MTQATTATCCPPCSSRWRWPTSTSPSSTPSLRSARTSRCATSACSQDCRRYESAHVYDRLNVELDTWVKTGDAGNVLVDGLAIKSLAADDDTPVGRRDHLLRLIRKTLDDYRGELARYADRGRHDPGALGSAYGIWPGMSTVIEQALSDLTVALERAELVDDELVM